MNAPLTSDAGRRYTFLGTSDEVNECDCCGKQGLKSTVAIHDTESGADLFFGVTCAARALKMQVADVKRGTAAADRAREEAARLAREAASRAEHARWTAHLVARTGGIRDWSGQYCIARMIEALGGMKAARVGYDRQL